MSSVKKEARARKPGSKNSSSAIKQGDKVGPESSLVRWLRSHTPQEKASPSEADAKTDSTTNAQKHRKHKKPKNASVKDDATRIKMRVRYFINIIMREQSLIDAYSADGWKGQSLEKIRPEQELKRADARIMQSKMRIRQELEQLHNLSLEGSIEEAAFEPDGQIYFDDIFCAICKSKEAFPENDIILCDGACNRGFHQFCLDPPLRTEDIPPGDDGWLCPVCDSKFECLDAINDNFGTDFKIEDNWEKVFAEAENVGAGDNLLGSQVDWPSEDSEDDDYQPETAKPSEAGESGKENASVEDSGSDSDSDSDSDSSDSGSEVEFFDEFAETSKGRKRPLFEDDERNGTGEMIEEHMEADDAVLVAGKRERPDVDYKQLYDEVYGADASDYESSEDEDWGKSKQSKGSTSSMERPTPEKRKRVSEGQDLEGVNGRKSSIKLSKEAVVKLQEVFQECELPSKARKQTLSSELGISFEDVNTWFRNARRASARKKKLGGAKFLEQQPEEAGTGKQDSPH